MKSILILLLFLPSIGFGALQIKLEDQSGQTEFLAVGNPGFIKIKGKGKGPSGQLSIENNKLNGTIELDLASLDTGMNLRNEHMRDKYLQVKEFPKAVLKITEQNIKENWSLSNPELSKGELTGVLQIHGQEKPVQIRYSLDSNSKVTAEFDIKITDFNIDIPSFMGVTVTEKVTVKIESKASEVK